MTSVPIPFCHSIKPFQPQNTAYSHKPTLFLNFHNTIHHYLFQFSFLFCKHHHPLSLKHDHATFHITRSFLFKHLPVSPLHNIAYFLFFLHSPSFPSMVATPQKQSQTFAPWFNGLALLWRDPQTLHPKPKFLLFKQTKTVCRRES